MQFYAVKNDRYGVTNQNKIKQNKMELSPFVITILFFLLAVALTGATIVSYAYNYSTAGAPLAILASIAWSIVLFRIIPRCC